MTIAELVKSFLDSSKERIKSPIAGAYILSFIIFNWKPIFILFFSKNCIEFRINEITRKYSDSGTFLWPILIAIIYTLSVPCVMLIIEYILIRPSKQRRKNIYNHKTSELDFQIILAGKELELQDARSQNKEKINLLDEISYLRGENNNLIESAKLDSEKFNAQIAETNNKLKNSLEKINELNRSLDYEKSLDSNLDNLERGFKQSSNDLNIKDFTFLMTLNAISASKKYANSVLSEKALKTMKYFEIITFTEKGAITFTEKGRNFLEYLHAEGYPDLEI